MAPTSLKDKLTSPFVTRRLPPAAGRRVLLTFDDGPTPGVTEGVLARLADHGAQAAFFVIGRRVAGREDLMRETTARGHAVCNHSKTHNDARLPSPTAYHRDIRLAHDEITRAIGTPPPLFRAPAGRLHPASLVSPLLLGMRHVLWSLDSLDWHCRDDDAGRETARRILATVADGDIILLHDYHTYIHALLDDLLPGLLERGFVLDSGLPHLGVAEGSAS